MKKFKLLLLISVGLCFAGIASAQLAAGYTIDGPNHPLKPAIGQPRILADTVIANQYIDKGHPSTYLLTREVYTFNENNRIDTICGNMEWYILKYSDKGQLLSLSIYTPGYESEAGAYIEPRERLWSEFEYGEDGRLAKDIRYGYERDSVYTYHYTMTDSGYIIDDYPLEYILDDQGRLICEKNLNSEDKYVYDSEGRKFRIGDMHYFYFDNGFSALKCYGFIGVPDLWEKWDYFFQKNRYLSKVIFYWKNEDEKEWKVYNHFEWSYYYRADNPLANIAIKEQPDGHVYSVAGAVVIETETAAMVSVYSFSGQLVTQQRVSDGTNSVALSKGIYIIVINDKGYKVAVK